MRRFTRAIVLALVLGLGCGACDWPMFRSGPEHAGTSKDTGISTSTVSHLVLDWSAATGGSVSSSPAIVNGSVYAGSVDHNLYAFDAAGATNCAGTPSSCGPLWRGPTGAAVQSSPAVANGVVYVTSGDGKL